MTLYASDFSKVFSTLLEENGISCYKISRYAHLDEAYLSRLKNGGKHDPSPETLIKISLALAHYGNQVQLDDIQRLFKSVGRSIITREVRPPFTRNYRNIVGRNVFIDLLAPWTSML